MRQSSLGLISLPPNFLIHHRPLQTLDTYTTAHQHNRGSPNFLRSSPHRVKQHLRPSFLHILELYITVNYLYIYIHIGTGMCIRHWRAGQYIIADLCLNSVVSAGMFANSWGWQGFCPAGLAISSSTACSQSCSANGRQITPPIPPTHT